MGAGHSHTAPLGVHESGAHRGAQGRLLVALGLLGGFLVLEVVAGLFTGSLALLSDAGHMFTDVLGLALALAALRAAARSTADPQRTFGWYRLEVLAALANAVLLSAVAGWVVIEAVGRIADPTEVLAGPMLAVAVGGLVANLAALAVLHGRAHGNLAMRAAYLEVLADLLGSVGVIVAAVVVATTGWRWADPVVAVAIGASILPRTWSLAREALRILTQAAPRGITVEDVRRDLGADDRVRGVHDVHVWTLTTGMDVASAHLAVTPDADVGAVLVAARRRLREAHGIDHATLQIEPTDTDIDCDTCHW